MSTLPCHTLRPLFIMLAIGLTALVVAAIACGPSAPAGQGDGVAAPAATPTPTPTAKPMVASASPTPKPVERASPVPVNTPVPTPTMSPEERAEQEHPTPAPPPTTAPAPTDPAGTPSETDLLPPIPTSVDFCHGLNRWEDGPEFFKYEPGCLYLYEKTAREDCDVNPHEWHSNDFLSTEKQTCLQMSYAGIGDYLHRVRLAHDCFAAGSDTRQQYIECKKAEQYRASEVINDLFTNQRLIMAAAEQNTAVVQAEKQVNTCLEGLEKEFPDVHISSSRTVYWLDALTIPFPQFRRAWAGRDAQGLEKVMAYTDRIHLCAEKAGYYPALHDSFVAELLRLSELEPSPVASMKLTGLADYRATAGPTQFAPRYHR